MAFFRVPEPRFYPFHFIKKYNSPKIGNFKNIDFLDGQKMGFWNAKKALPFFNLLPRHFQHFVFASGLKDISYFYEKSWRSTFRKKMFSEKQLGRDCKINIFSENIFFRKEIFVFYSRI
jgi:hypothetical protein